MKTFNLDNIDNEVLLQVTVNKQTHNVVAMSTGDFIATMKDAAALEKIHKEAKANGGAESVETIVASMEILVRSVSRAVPTLTDAEIKALPMKKLYALNDFIRGTVPEDLREQVGLEDATPSETEPKKS